jgi:hypothetical protein
MIQTSHTYGILKTYNVKVDFDMIFLEIMIACCLLMLFILTFKHIITWKEFDEEFLSLNIKRAHTPTLFSLSSVDHTNSQLPNYFYYYFKWPYIILSVINQSGYFCLHVWMKSQGKTTNIELVWTMLNSNPHECPTHTN